VATSVAVEGGIAFAIDASVDETSGTLRIVDATYPASPMEVGTYTGPGTLHDVAVAGGVAYVAAQANGVVVLDVHAPSLPAETGMLPASDARFVAVDARRLYLLDGDRGVRIFDVATPGSPVLLGTAAVPASAERFGVGGGLLAVPHHDTQNGATDVFDVTVPATPTFASSTALQGPPVVRDGRYLHTRGDIHDFADPVHPALAGFVWLPADRPAAGAGGRFYLASAAGLFVLRHTPGDTDSDGIADDGDASGTPGDTSCTGGATVGCDDNCRWVANAEQADADADGDGVGDVCACAPCDDGRSCTVDLCEVGRGCFTRPVGGTAAFTCAFDVPLRVAACDGQRVPRRVFRDYARARRLARRAADRPARREALLGRASRRIDRALRRIGRLRARRNPPLTADCAAGLETILGDARAPIATSAAD
jgi:hypothetical protein